MKVIKFRVYYNAKDYPQLTKMHYFDLFSFNSDDGSQWLDTNDNHDILNYYELKDYPIMQYTGIKDKNGKEIYEGDIVRSFLDDEKNIFEVQWENFGWNFRENDEDYEVIGNIYENPGLLK